jgi:hypothetical protein
MERLTQIVEHPRFNSVVMRSSAELRETLRRITMDPPHYPLNFSERDVINLRL